MTAKSPPSREQRVEIIKHRLLRKSAPRLQVMLILFLTGVVGFFVSFSLLHLGIRAMALRYPIAILLAYFVFLALLAVWLWRQRRNSTNDLELPDFGLSPSDVSSNSGDVQFVQDEHFVGGGAGGSWGQGDSSASSIPGDSPLKALDAGLDLEEGLLIVLAVLAVTGGLLASLYVVYIAPALLAEILVDGLLVASLYKQVKGIEQRHWLRAAVRQTIVPALIAMLFFAIAGYALQKAVPEARSIGEVWRHTRG